MIKVISLDDKGEEIAQTEAARTVEDYYNAASPEELGKMRSAIFDSRKDLEERKKAYVKHRETILSLKPLFKKFVLENNKASARDGFKNFFEFITHRDGIPKEDLELFFERVDEVIETLNKKVHVPWEKADWFWSKFNLPHSPTFKHYEVLDPEKYNYSHLRRRIEEERPELANALSEIRIEALEKDAFSYSRTFFDEKEKTVSVYIPFWRLDIHNVSSFLHGLARALAFIALLERGVNPLSKSRYWHEKEIIKTEQEFEEILLPQRIREILEVDLLRTFSQTLFEHQIYNNPGADFDKLYAKVINRCYLGASQRENPFYVLDSYLIARPVCTVVYSVAKSKYGSWVRIPPLPKGPTKPI